MRPGPCPKWAGQIAWGLCCLFLAILTLGCLYRFLTE